MEISQNGGASPLRLYVLGGSDPRPGPVPKGMRQEQMLRGCKGALALPNGRCLAQELIQRARQSGCFVEPVLVGPARIYDGLVDCRIVDVSGDLSETLGALRSELHRLPDAEQPVAFTTCDILPTAGEFHDLLSAEYRPHRTACLWGQLVESAPEAMGSSAWKPSYGFRTHRDAPPGNLYPGHLLVMRPAAVRLRLMNHLLQLAYRHRNLRIDRRPLPMLVRGLGQLIRADAGNLRRWQFPLLTVSIPWHCLSAFLKFRRRRLTVEEFSHAVMKVFLHRDFHAWNPPAVVFSTTGIRSFAKDIDTTDELKEAAAGLR